MRSPMVLTLFGGVMFVALVAPGGILKVSA